jgi:hypothetical protein
VQNGGISADATTLMFRILHFMQEIFQEAGCAKQIVIHFAVTNHAAALPRFGMVSSPGASRHRRRGVLNSYPSSQPLGRLAEISLKWLLLRPYDKGEEARYATVARAGTHIGHLQWRVRENIGALTLVQDHGRLSGGSYLN